MSEYNIHAYQHRGSFPPTFEPYLEIFADQVQTHFQSTTPHIVEIGAGSGSLSKKLDRLGNFKITAIDASPDSLLELTSDMPNINLIRSNVSNAKFDEPIHALVSKDCLIAIRSLSDFLRHVKPALVHGALFMLTVFVDEPGLGLAFSGVTGKNWHVVSSREWTPSPNEVDRDWYSSFVATRKIITAQYFG